MDRIDQARNGRRLVRLRFLALNAHSHSHREKRVDRHQLLVVEVALPREVAHLHDTAAPPAPPASASLSRRRLLRDASSPLLPLTSSADCTCLRRGVGRLLGRTSRRSRAFHYGRDSKATLQTGAAFGLVDCPRFVATGTDGLGLEKGVDSLPLDMETDDLGLEKALEELSTSIAPLESTPSSARSRPSFLGIVLVRTVVLVIKDLQPLHELQVVLGTSLYQPLHVDVLRVSPSLQTLLSICYTSEKRSEGSCNSWYIRTVPSPRNSPSAWEPRLHLRSRHHLYLETACLGSDTRQHLTVIHSHFAHQRQFPRSSSDSSAASN